MAQTASRAWLHVLTPLCKLSLLSLVRVDTVSVQEHSSILGGKSQGTVANYYQKSEQNMISQSKRQFTRSLILKALKVEAEGFQAKLQIDGVPADRASWPTARTRFMLLSKTIRQLLFPPPPPPRLSFPAPSRLLRQQADRFRKVIYHLYATDFVMYVREKGVSKTKTQGR